MSQNPTHSETVKSLGALSRRLEKAELAAEVGSAAIEAALSDLDRAIRRDRCHAVVAAPPGPGKSLLLGALAERLDLPMVHVRPPWGDDEICSQILHSLGEDPNPDPEMRLLSVVQEIGSRGAGLVLLIEDAGSLAPATLRRLGRLAALARPDLRMALAVTAEGGSGAEAIRRVVGTLGVSAEKVVLESRPERADAPPAPAPSESFGDSFQARAREEKAFEAMHLEPRSVPWSGIRYAAAIALGSAVAVFGANHLEIGSLAPAALAPVAVEAPPAVAEAPPVAVEASPAVQTAAVSRSSVDRNLASYALLESLLSEGEPALEPEAPAPVSAGAPAQPPAPAPPERGAAAAPVAAQLEVARVEPKLREPMRVAPVAPSPKPREPVAAAPAAKAPGPVNEPAAPKQLPEPPAPPEPVAVAVPVSLNAQPWAHIEVDGRHVGVTPLADVPLTPGRHQFRAHLPDGSVVERDAEVDAYRDHVVFP